LGADGQQDVLDCQVVQAELLLDLAQQGSSGS
jgi:hypothetical protein